MPPYDCSKVTEQRHGERDLPGEGPAEETGQNAHTLVVGGSRKPGLPLDIDDAFPPESHPGGDPRRLPESMVAEVVDGEAVDLSDDLPIGGDMDHAIRDEFVGPVLRQPMPALASGLGGRNMPPSMASAPSRRAWKSASLWRSARSENRLENRRRQPPRVNGLFEHGRHAGSIHGQEAILLGHLLQHREDVGRMIAGQGDHRVEIGEHLEDLGKIRIPPIEIVVDVPISDDDDLDVAGAPARV